MIARFHTLHVPMAGVDVHRIEGGNKPCVVACPFEWVSNNDKYAKKVTGHTYSMVQRGYQLGFVLHGTVVATEAGALELAAVIVTSSSKAALGVESVSAEGTPLATAMAGALGLNLNCWSASGNSFKSPSGVTISEFPLLTNPTIDDWVDWFLTLLWDSAFSWGAGKTIDRPGIPPQQRAIIKKFVSEKVKPIIERNLKKLKDGLKAVTRSDSAQVFDTVLE